MLCYRPLPDADYHVGYEPTRSINGAVLRLPKGSATLNHLLDWFEDPEFVPPWLPRKIRKEVEAAPPGKRLLKAFELQRPSLGPRALDHTLNLTGEVQHVRPAGRVLPDPRRTDGRLLQRPLPGRRLADAEYPGHPPLCLHGAPLSQGAPARKTQLHLPLRTGNRF